MCQSLAFSGFGSTIVATDTRWSWQIDGNDFGYEDFGAKLRRIPNGWCAATGDARASALGLRSLSQRGVEGAQAALDDAIAEARDHCLQIGRGLPLTHFLLGSDHGALEVISTEPGATHRVEPHPGKVQLRASWAPNLLDDGGGVRAAFARRIVKPGGLANVVYTFASAFVEAREYGGETMSDEVELGVSLWRERRNGYLRGRAVDIADMCRRSAGVQFQPLPVLPPFPELPSERRLFPSFAGTAP